MLYPVSVFIMWNENEKVIRAMMWMNFNTHTHTHTHRERVFAIRINS